LFGLLLNFTNTIDVSLTTYSRPLYTRCVNQEAQLNVSCI